MAWLLDGRIPHFKAILQRQLPLRLPLLDDLGALPMFQVQDSLLHLGHHPKDGRVEGHAVLLPLN